MAEHSQNKFRKGTDRDHMASSKTSSFSAFDTTLHSRRFQISSLWIPLSVIESTVLVWTVGQTREETYGYVWMGP